MLGMQILKDVTQNVKLALADEDVTSLDHVQSPHKSILSNLLGKNDVANPDPPAAGSGAAPAGVAAGGATGGTNAGDNSKKSGIPTWVWVAGAAAVVYYMTNQ